GKQMQPVLQSAWQLPVLLLEIFRIAHDRMADVGAMGAQLMGAPRYRLEREPSQLARGGLDDGVIRHRVARALLAVSGDAHARIAFKLFLGEERRDAALARLRAAGRRGPKDFSPRPRGRSPR